MKLTTKGQIWKSISLSNKRLKLSLRIFISITITLLLLMRGLNISAQVLETSDIPEGVYKGVFIQMVGGSKLKSPLHILVANGFITGVIKTRFGSQEIPKRITFLVFNSKAKSPGRYGELVFSLLRDSTIKVKS